MFRILGGVAIVGVVFIVAGICAFAMVGAWIDRKAGYLEG